MLEIFLCFKFGVLTRFTRYVMPRLRLPVNPKKKEGKKVQCSHDVLTHEMSSPVLSILLPLSVRNAVCSCLTSVAEACLTPGHNMLLGNGAARRGALGCPQAGKNSDRLFFPFSVLSRCLVKADVSRLR